MTTPLPHLPCQMRTLRRTAAQRSLASSSPLLYRARNTSFFIDSFPSFSLETCAIRSCTGERTQITQIDETEGEREEVRGNSPVKQAKATCYLTLI